MNNKTLILIKDKNQYYFKNLNFKDVDIYPLYKKKI